MSETIVTEIFLDLPDNFDDKYAILEWISRFKYCQISFGMDYRHRLSRPEKDAYETYQDSTPKGGHISFSIMRVMESKKQVLRIRGIEREKYQRATDAPTVLEYMTALQAASKASNKQKDSLAFYLARHKEYKRELARRHSSA